MIINKEKIKYPVIINKYLSLKKICSRKEADRLLKAGKIFINQKLAEPGQMVVQSDKVEVELITKNLVYLACHKPKGIITHSPQKGERSIDDIFKFSEKVFPVGRLDKQSSGLIIMTNDGRVTDRLLNPDFWHEKEYEVKVNKQIDQRFIKLMSGGVRLDDGYLTRRCQVGSIDSFSFSILLTEGKNRQIRRMCEALGVKVVELKRVRIMNIKLDNLQSGKYKKIIGSELTKFLSAIGL